MNVKDQLENMHVEETVSVYIELTFKAKHQARSASRNSTRNTGHLLNTENQKQSLRIFIIAPCIFVESFNPYPANVENIVSF